MRIADRRMSLLLAVACLLAGAACSSPDSKIKPPPPPPPAVGSGIQQLVSLNALVTGGWSVCHEDRYGDQGTTVANLLAGCAGPYLMLACRLDGTTDTLTLAAADTRAVVTQADAVGASHTSGTVSWYYADSTSWGFFPASDTGNPSSCDMDPGAQTNKDRRLCWNVLDAALLRGYRCGDNALGVGSAIRRLVLVHQ